MGELVLVRHGQTEWSRTGRHTGLTDVPLTEEGERQAASLRAPLARRRFALVATSPLARAVRTAELAGLEGPVVLPDLVEWDYGAYEGITSAEIHEGRPEWDLWTDGVPPGDIDHPGEGPEQVAERVDQVLERVVPVLEEGDVALVAHGHVLRVLTARRLGLPPGRGALFRMETGVLGVLGTEHGRPVLGGWNLTG
ncbi:histidine phosphatase family protein [Nocardiopsis alba]|uniref:Histidine phosphatase family protein n=1 Tax=Nocardiopsis alba TaxID=53437 RepID=A0ABV5DRB6_9ACTN